MLRVLATLAQPKAEQPERPLSPFLLSFAEHGITVRKKAEQEATLLAHPSAEQAKSNLAPLRQTDLLTADGGTRPSVE